MDCIVFVEIGFRIWNFAASRESTDSSKMSNGTSDDREESNLYN